MAYTTRAPSQPSTSNTSSLRPSHSHSLSNQPASAALQARINQKRAELENLTQLRDLSSNLTQQLETLEAKLGTLRDGAQSIALVLANWENVLGVIRMVGVRAPALIPTDSHREGDVDAGGERDTEEGGQDREMRDVAKARGRELPVPLVRIPVESKTGDGG